MLWNLLTADVLMNCLAVDEAVTDEAAGDEVTAKNVAAENSTVNASATKCDALEFTHCGRSNELSGGR